jgi:hypothetical protein
MTNLARHMSSDDMEMAKKMGFLNADGTPKAGAMKSIPEGASTTLTAAFDPRMKDHNGGYLVDNQPIEVGSMGPSGIQLEGYAVDMDDAQRLWDLSNKLAGENFK